MATGKKERVEKFKWFFISDIPILMPSKNVAKQLIVELWLSKPILKSDRKLNYIA